MGTTETGGPQSASGPNAEEPCTDEGGVDPVPETDEDLVVFMEPEASGEDIEALDESISTDDRVDRFVYFDKAAAYREFQEYFADQPEMIEILDPEVLPTSFRLYTANLDGKELDDLRLSLEAQRGVQEVIDPLRWERDRCALHGAVEPGAVDAFVGGTLVVDNQTHEALTLRNYSFGDGPETTSERIDVPPGGSAEATCGFLREFDLVDEDEQVLPIFVPCPASGREILVVTDEHLPG